MAIKIHNRRFSAIVDSLRNMLSSEKQYRSLSTGDLATSRPENDFMEMHFFEHPTTSSTPAHFDDCDRVPVNFSRSGNVKLLSQTSAKAREIARSGSYGNIQNASIEDIHRSQTWFFVDVEPRKAERILMSNGLVDSSFLISYYQKKYIISIWNSSKSKAQHLVIRRIEKKNGNIVFQLDIDKNFKNLVELVQYYTKNKGYVLSSKLSRGVSRPTRCSSEVRSRA